MVIDFKLNHPGKEFTLGIDVRTVLMAEVDEDDFPDDSSEWNETLIINLGFFIFNIVIYV